MGKKLISRGDAVTVVFGSTYGLPSLLAGKQAYYVPDVKVIHVPQGEGDTWQFELNDGTAFVLNPYSSDLQGMIRQKPPEGAL